MIGWMGVSVASVRSFSVTSAPRSARVRLAVVFAQRVSSVELAPLGLLTELRGVQIDVAFLA